MCSKSVTAGLFVATYTQPLIMHSLTSNTKSITEEIYETNATTHFATKKKKHN